MDPFESDARVELVDGQVDDDQRHEVAERFAVLGRSAQRHRHHCLDHPVLDVGVAVFEQERAQRAAARGEHDVVDAHVVAFANRRAHPPAAPTR